MDEAVQLIADRIAKGPSKPKGRRAKKAQSGGQGGGQGRAKSAEAKPKAAKAKKPKAGGTREAAE